LVNAAPASFFEPFLDNLPSKLSSDVRVRLPTSVPSTFHGKEIRFLSFEEENYFAIIVHLPGCEMASCEVTRFVSAPQSYLSLDTQIKKGSSVTLKPGIHGFYQVGESVRGPIARVFWQQDGLGFGVVAPLKERSLGSISRQQIINAAISMANEPVTRLSSGY